jgi:polar amino acid transport system substrate-binding protein
MKTPRFLAAVALALVALTAEARTLEEIKKAGTIVAASEGAFPPFNFFEGKKLVGFEIDVGDEIAKRLGVQVEWKALAFDALLAGLQTDRFDMVIASFGVTPERQKAVDFTEPHYCTGGVIVSKGGKVKTPADLAGKTVVVQTGTTYLQNVQKLKGLKGVKNFPKDTDARAAVVAGRADAWVTDKFVAKEALEKDPKAGLVMGDFLFVEQVATAVRKGNTSLTEAINKALADMMADGTYEKLSKKYFGEDIRCPKK